MNGLPPKLPMPPLTSHRPRITTVRGPLLIGVGVLLLVLLFVGLVISGSRQKAREQQAQTPSTPPTPSAVPRDTLAGVPRTYQQALKPKDVEAAVPPAVERQLTRIETQPPQAVPLGTRPIAAPGPAGSPPAVVPQTPAVVPPMAQGQPSRGAGPAMPPTPREERKSWRLKDALGGGDELAQSPFGDAKHDREERTAPPLLKDATWVRPVDVTRVVYRIQPIPALTLGRISSDIPNSDVRLLVTRNVMDRWGKRVLIPQHTQLVGLTQGGQPGFGETRLGVTLAELHYPDGTILDLSKAKTNDRAGQAGLTGSVDNHLLQTGIAILLSAALSTGTRTAAGNPSGFQENLPQQFAGQAAQSFNQSGQDLVRRQLLRPPTITIPEGTEVVITLQENLNLGQPPTLVR